MASVAREWNQMVKRPFIGFLSNEISEKKSQELMEAFSVEGITHIGTALFAPWRKANNLEEWYQMHPLNRTPFAGGLYINFKGVYLNEAALLMDLRQGITTDLKIGEINHNGSKENQLEMLYKKANVSHLC